LQNVARAAATPTFFLLFFSFLGNTRKHKDRNAQYEEVIREIDMLSRKKQESKVTKLLKLIVTKDTVPPKQPNVMWTEADNPKLAPPLVAAAQVAQDARTGHTVECASVVSMSRLQFLWLRIGHNVGTRNVNHIKIALTPQSAPL
jgi:hypothetical protein